MMLLLARIGLAGKLLLLGTRLPLLLLQPRLQWEVRRLLLLVLVHCCVGKLLQLLGMYV